MVELDAEETYYLKVHTQMFCFLNFLTNKEKIVVFVLYIKHYLMTDSLRRSELTCADIENLDDAFWKSQ